MRTDAIIKWTKGPDVLDVGCAGHVVKPESPYWLHGRLRAHFPEVVGIDISSENVAKMREAGFENVTAASAEEFRLAARFDTIVAGELVEHLANPGLFLSRCREHVKPGGRVVMSTPYVFSLLYFIYALKNFPRTCENDQHALWLCPKTAAELAARGGFRVCHWELIEDYEYDNPSLRYRVFASTMATVGRLVLPGRLRKNNMLLVLEAQ